MTPQQPQQECRYVKIESCTECNNRCEMKDLYKPYGMIPVPSGHEISDFFGRWVCTESNDMEIKNYTGNFPKWCPLSRPHTSSTEAPETPLPNIPTPCSYLYIEGMNVKCQDSYSPSRINCHHCVSWRCWDITNIREAAIRNATLKEAISLIQEKIDKVFTNSCRHDKESGKENPFFLRAYCFHMNGLTEAKNTLESLRAKEQPSEAIER